MSDDAARVWDAWTGKPVTKPLAHNGRVRAAAFSPDGATRGHRERDKIARVWDARTGKPAHRAPRASRLGPRGGVQPRRRACGHRSEDETARVWDARAGEPLTEPDVVLVEGAVLAAALSPDGARVVTVSGDEIARVWDARTGKRAAESSVRRSRGPRGGVQPRWLARGHRERRPDRTDVGRANRQAASPSPSRTKVGSARRRSAPTARAWSPRATTGPHGCGTRGPASLSPSPSRIQATCIAAAFSPDGARVVTVSDDGTARVWDARTGKPAHRAPRASRQGRRGGVQPRRRARGHRERTRPRGCGTRGPASPSPSPSCITAGSCAAAFSPDGARVVTASGTRPRGCGTRGPASRSPSPSCIKARSTRWRSAPTARASSPRATTRPRGCGTRGPASRSPNPSRIKSPVLTAAFSRDGARVVTASDDQTVRVWELPRDTGSLDDWRRRARCGVFALDNGILVENHSPCP